MHEFFSGWRRKTGCITLAIAVVVTGMWLRAQIVEDAHFFTDGRITDKQTIWFISRSPGVLWGRERIPDDISVGYPMELHTVQYPTGDPTDFSEYLDPWFSDTIDQSHIEWRWRGFGFEFGRYQEHRDGELESTVSFWIIPYWSVAAPLTLLSAYLMLWTPRKRASDD